MSRPTVSGVDGASGARVGRILPWLAVLVGVLVAAVLVARDEIGWTGAVAVVSVGVVLALALAAIVELRARDRLRTSWLGRLHRLTDDLARALENEDPPEAVRRAAARAARGVSAPRTMEAERLAFLRSVADQSAQAHERIALVQAQQRARDDLDLLARAVPRLAASLDVAKVTETIESLVVPRLADSCRLRVVGASGRSGGVDEPLPAGATAVPLVGARGPVGELVVARDGGPLSADDLATITLLAEPAARALGHALLFTEEVHASSTLQNSLLPRAVLDIPGLEVATRYLAATEGQAVGGDFYDVLRTPDGRAVLVVGDVQGKGIEAAALTSTARHTLRSAALEGAGPGDMLRVLNDALLYADAERTTATGSPSVRFVTASVVALTPTEDGFSGAVATGGHPPPLVIRPGGTVDPIVAEGPLLGVFADAAYKEAHVAIDRADILVLYTDGVTEQRRQPELFDEVQLGRLVRNQLTVRRADAVAQLILDTVVDLNPRDVRDDIALVVARVTGASPLG